MDKNSITGFVLIGALIFAFSWYNQPSKEQIAEGHRQDSIAKVEALKMFEEQQNALLSEQKAQETVYVSDSARQDALKKQFGEFASAIEGDNKIISLENEYLSLKFSSKGGVISEALLKDYNTYDSLPVILFNEKDSKYGFSLITASNRVVNTADLYFTPVNVTDSTVTMRLSADTDSYIDFAYTLPKDGYTVKFDINQKNMNGVMSPKMSNLNMFWSQELRRQEKGRTFEERYSAIYFKHLNDNTDDLKSSGDVSENVVNKLKWIAFKNQFFSSVLISRDGFNGASLDSKDLKDNEKYLKDFRAETEVAYSVTSANPASFDFYLGPNLYPMLRKTSKALGEEDLQLEKLVPLGASVFRWVNVYLVIPVFTFLGKYITNYGIIILLLTIFIKLILFPLTYKSYVSQAKMRVLRPEINEINDKYPGQDNAMKRQQETMALYSKVGINPMGGCLPMLLQMPILFAMFQFFPSSIELRGESFLWAKDLSSYDSIFSWDTYIPLVSTYFGNHISLFCLLMTAVNIINTKISMGNNPGQTEMPGMKVMMYMMPLMFLFIFNNYAAGLSYYYFVSTLITILQTYLIRKTMNEDKILAELKQNAKKPKKKSGFLARLEEAQRQQQDALKKKNKGK